jgi:hypothetical protein
MAAQRLLYQSSNGDSWYLIRESSGHIFIRHRANKSSGGKVTDLNLSTFLSYGSGPEQMALSKLIGSLAVDEVESGPAESSSGRTDV